MNTLTDRREKTNAFHKLKGETDPAQDCLKMGEVFSE